MAHAAIGLDGLQPLEVETALAAQIALDQVVAADAWARGAARGWLAKREQGA